MEHEFVVSLLVDQIHLFNMPLAHDASLEERVMLDESVGLHLIPCVVQKEYLLGVPHNSNALFLVFLSEWSLSTEKNALRLDSTVYFVNVI